MFTATLPNWPTMQSNSSGANVSALQCLLINKGNTTIIENGVYNGETVDAINDAQMLFGLSQTGIADAAFLPEMIIDVSQGSVNEAVKAAQYLLNKFGEDLEPDGNFGPISDIAVKAFQTQMGLPPDGVIGPISWQYLFGYDAYPGSGAGAPVFGNKIYTFFSQIGTQPYMNGISSTFKSEINEKGCFACSLAMALTALGVSGTSVQTDIRTNVKGYLKPDPVTVCLASMNFPNPISSDPTSMFLSRVAAYFGVNPSSWTQVNGDKTKIKYGIDGALNTPNRSPIILHLDNGNHHYVIATGYKIDSSGALTDVMCSDPAKSDVNIGINVSFITPEAQGGVRRGGNFAYIKEYVYLSK